MANPTLLLRASTFLASIAFSFFFFFVLAHSQGGDVTSFTFDSFVPNPTDLIYQGDTHVPQNSQALRLTKTDSSGMFPATLSTGRVLYSEPVHFWDSNRESTFETTISFSISPGTRGSADGLAFFIAPTDTAIPPDSPAQNLGIFNSSGTAASIFAVEFDTYVNSGLDPDYPHIGVDINSMVSRNTTRFDSGTGDRVTARIDYDSNTRAITVRATSGSSTAELSYVLDLKTVLPQWVRVGISSATGPTAAVLGIHDIHSWYFTSTLVWHNADGEGEKEETYIKKYTSSE